MLLRNSLLYKAKSEWAKMECTVRNIIHSTIRFKQRGKLQHGPSLYGN